MNMARVVRVVLVDDHLMVRQALHLMFESYPNIELVGEAGNGEEALAQVETLQPDVVVMDINLPKMDRVAATREMKHRYPHVAILGLSYTAQGYQAEAIRRAGAFDVITKERAMDELYGAIQRAAVST